MDLIIATNNEHKLEEYRALFQGYDIKIYSPNDLHLKFQPIENGKTYQANSLIKAKALQKLTKLPVLADDSGFEIKALDGFPGLYSNRYAKKFKSQAEANLSLVEKTKNLDKDARFICAITLLNIEEEPLFFVGIAKGLILDKPVGEEGFGYDPIFYSSDANKPFGELTLDEKNHYSHRYHAVKEVIKYLLENNFIKAL